jgi:hypothetical protein
MLLPQQRLCCPRCTSLGDGPCALARLKTHVTKCKVNLLTEPYSWLKLPINHVKTAIFGHPEFTAFNQSVVKLFTRWKKAAMPQLQGFDQGGHPKALIESLEFPMPPLPEQTAIAAILSDMDAELAALVARRDKTRALKQAMLQELLTGRTRLLEANK